MHDEMGAGVLVCPAHPPGSSCPPQGLHSPHQNPCFPEREVRWGQARAGPYWALLAEVRGGSPKSPGNPQVRHLRLLPSWPERLCEPGWAARTWSPRYGPIPSWLPPGAGEHAHWHPGNSGTVSTWPSPPCRCPEMPSGWVPRELASAESEPVPLPLGMASGGT